LRADEMNSSVPHLLSDVIARSLEVDPDRRFQSAVALGRTPPGCNDENPRAGLGAAADHSRTPTTAGGRKHLFLAHPAVDLRRLRYEVEQFLATHPYEIDACVLRDEIDYALQATVTTSPRSAGDRTTASLLSKSSQWRRYLAVGTAVFG